METRPHNSVEAMGNEEIVKTPDVENVADEYNTIMNNGEEEDAYLLKEDSEENDLDGIDDPDIEAMKARVKEMEEEAEKLKEMQKEAEDSLIMSSPTSTVLTSPVAALADKGEADARSVYVGNVDYSATATDLEQHFHGTGSVNRVTILCDKFTGTPKGFAYVEFNDKESVETACQLTDSLFKGRQIKVTPKRTNIPGLSSTNRFPRSRGRGRGRGYGGYGGYRGYSPRRGRGSFRSRRAQYYSPY